MEYYNMDNLDDIINKASPSLIGKIKLEPMLIAKLRQSGVLTESLDDELEPVSLTPNQKILMLIEDLKVGPIERFLHFCRIMHEAKQTHVIQYLKVEMGKIYSQLGMQPPAKEPPSSTESIHPLWAKEHPSGKTILERDGDLYPKIRKGLPDLKKVVRIKNVWSHLQRYQVIEGLDEEDILAEKTNEDKVEALMRFLKIKEVWRTHALFRSLAETEQTYVIDLVLGEGHEAIYKADLEGGGYSKLMHVDSKAKDNIAVIKPRKNLHQGHSPVPSQTMEYYTEPEGKHEKVVTNPTKHCHQDYPVPSQAMEYGIQVDQSESYLGSAKSQSYTEEEKRAADLFFHGTAGTLQLPGSDVILRVPAKAVPEGKVFVVHGTIHTDVREYRKLLSKCEVIVGPVPEYTVESGEAFNEHVEIQIPHCVRPDKIMTLQVIYGSGEVYRVLEKDDPEITYRVEKQHVCVFTKHFSRFILKSKPSYEEEEITDTVLTIAASRKGTKAISVTCLRLMLHSGCAGMKDFIDFRKQTHVKVRGRDVLRLGEGGRSRSEKLTNLTLKSPLKQQLQCSLDVMYHYEEPIGKMVESYNIVYPVTNELHTYEEGTEECREPSGDLTYNDITKLIHLHSPEIFLRLDLSHLLTAHLLKAGVIGEVEMNELVADKITRHDKIAKIMDSIRRGRVAKFLDFCLVLANPEIDQTHIVTEVLKLSMSYVRDQRDRFKTIDASGCSAREGLITTNPA